MADLKYSEEDNTPLELAENYREDGNFNFKCKKYRYASISYTEGIKHAIREKDDKVRTISYHINQALYALPKRIGVSCSSS